MIVTVITMALSALNDLSPGDAGMCSLLSVLTAVFISLKRLFAMIALPVEILVSSVYVRTNGCGRRAIMRRGGDVSHGTLRARHPSQLSVPAC